MLRRSLGLVRGTPNRIWARNNVSSSGGSGSGGGGKALLGIGVGGMAALGGTVGYAGVDKDFRKMVEDNIPGSDMLFRMVHGDLEPKPEKPAVPPSKKKPISIPPTTTTPPLPPPPPPPTPPSAALPSKAKAPVEKEPVAPVMPPAPPLEKPPAAPEKTVTLAPAPDKESAQPTPEKKVEEKPADVVVVEKKQEEELEQHPVLEEPPKVPKAGSRAAQKKAVGGDEEAFGDDDEQLISAGKDLHKKVQAVRDELEQEMRTQLKRQAEAHADHIADALDVQQKELIREHIRHLDESLEKAQLAHRDQLAGIVGHLKGLQTSLLHRAHMDAAALEAQELWLACSALNLAVESSEASGQGVRNLNREISAVKRVLSNHHDDPFVRAVLASLSDVVFRRGVITQEAIKERFIKVEEMAKRTAMVGDDGGSLIKYFLSYLQSKMIVEPPTLKELPDKTTATDLDALNTFELVWLARGSLDRGDLEQAVKYISLLKGEPKNISQDWLTEARLLLETKQASRALMAHAAAIGVEALPVKRKH